MQGIFRIIDHFQRSRPSVRLIVCQLGTCLRQDVAVPTPVPSAADLRRLRACLAERYELSEPCTPKQRYRRLAHLTLCPSKSETGRFRPTYSPYPYTGSLSPLRLLGPAMRDVRVADCSSRGRRGAISDLGAHVRRSGVHCATCGSSRSQLNPVRKCFERAEHTSSRTEEGRHGNQPHATR